MAGPGRSQRVAMERLVRLMAVLSEAGPHGALGEKLQEIAGFSDGDPASQLAREFRHLKAQGWQIDNIAQQGEPARYRLVSGDNRLRLKLTPSQQSALLRAVLVADRGDLAAKLGLPGTAKPPEISADVLRHDHREELTRSVAALQSGALIRFRYKGQPRVVHPASVKHQNGQWYLSGIEDGSDVLKHFVVTRMSEVALDAPNSAEPVPALKRLPLHPMRWEVDPPVDVVLRTPVEFVADVERWLARPKSVIEQDGVAELIYVVTHRAAFRARIYALGLRVEVVSPDDVRRELLTELEAMAGV